MGKWVRLLVTLAGCGVGVYLLAPTSGDDVPISAGAVQSATRETTVASGATQTPSRLVAEPTLVAEEHAKANRRQVLGQWATITFSDLDERPAPRPATSSTPGNRLSSAKPGDDTARAQLVRDIQSELRRVGCYDGELHGWWSSNTKRAMKAFTDRVNATLPVGDADYILLTLVRGHKGLACGKTCPAGQVATSEGCLPRAVVAQRGKGGEQKLTASAVDAGTAGHVQLQAEREALPGRMAVGVQVDTAAELARRQAEPLARDAQQPSHALRTPGGEGSGAAALPGTPDGEARPRPQRSEPRPERRSSKSARKISTRNIMATIQLNAP